MSVITLITNYNKPTTLPKKKGTIKIKKEYSRYIKQKRNDDGIKSVDSRERPSDRVRERD